MTTLDMRQKLHKYVEECDDFLLLKLYALVKEHHKENGINIDFTEVEIHRFEERSASRLNEESKTYDVKAARDKITVSGNSGVD
ncbi:MAG: hypothetical protein ACK5CC_01645 [Bacteroidota bacterium]